MKIEANRDNLKIIEKEKMNAGSVAIYTIEFEFSDEWNDVVKELLIIKNDKIWTSAIIDNFAEIPYLKRGIYSIAVKGIKTNTEGKVEKLISTNLLQHQLGEGSGEYEVTEEEQPISVATYEKYLKKITAKSEKISEDIKTIETLKAEIEEKQNDFNNNVEKKLDNFNNNYVEKKELIDKVYKDTVEVKENAEKEIKKGLDDYNSNAEQKQQEINKLADGVKDMATAIQFATFEVDNDMKLAINTAEKLANTSFNYNENTGELEVEITNG